MYIRDLENITDGGSKTAFPWVIAAMSFDEGLSTVLTRNIVIYQVNVLLQPLQRVLARKEASPCSPGKPDPFMKHWRGKKFSDVNLGTRVVHERKRQIHFYILSQKTRPYCQLPLQRAALAQTKTQHNNFDHK